MSDIRWQPTPNCRQNHSDSLQSWASKSGNGCSLCRPRRRASAVNNSARCRFVCLRLRGRRRLGRALGFPDRAATKPIGLSFLLGGFSEMRNCSLLSARAFPVAPSGPTHRLSHVCCVKRVLAGHRPFCFAIFPVFFPDIAVFGPETISPETAHTTTSHASARIG